MLVGVIGGFAGGIKLAQGHLGKIGAGAWPLFGIGLVLMASGIVIRWWAIIVLGRYFTPDVRVQSDQQVVKPASYRQVSRLEKRECKNSAGPRRFSLDF